MYFRNLTFALIDSDYRFSVQFDTVGPEPYVYIMKVKPGRYYLRTLGRHNSRQIGGCNLYRRLAGLRTACQPRQAHKLQRPHRVYE
jgi:hypothetical protein